MKMVRMVILILLFSSGVPDQALQTYKSYTHKYGRDTPVKQFSHHYQEFEEYVSKSGSYLKLGLL